MKKRLFLCAKFEENIDSNDICSTLLINKKIITLLISFDQGSFIVEEMLFAKVCLNHAFIRCIFFENVELIFTRTSQGFEDLLDVYKNINKFYVEIISFY